LTCSDSQDFHSGFVGVIGCPNTGKSTLVNRAVGEKISIVSRIPGTTRTRITGILTRPDAQIVFLDTPGIRKPLHRLGQHMIRSAESVLDDVDLLLFVVDAVKGGRSGDMKVIRRLPSPDGAPVWLVINKADLATNDRVVELQGKFMDAYPFARVFVVSALTGLGVRELVDEVIETLPLGPRYYPDDWVTDHPWEFVIAEFIREKVMEYTREEVPHSVAVVVDRIHNRSRGKDIVDVYASIIVERESQKGIIIGKGGRMLKRIGRKARTDVENLLGTKVNLQLWVKVQDDWRQREYLLQSLGFD